MDNQAEKLNKILNRNGIPILEMLSDKGKRIFFPKEGIVAQTTEAKDTDINATAGIAMDLDNYPMRLSSIESHLKDISPNEIYPYSSSYGNDELRKSWKQSIHKKNPSMTGKMTSLPVVTSAITNGLSIAGYLFVEDGDDIIIPDLYWSNYILIYEHWFGAKLKTFSTFKDNKLNIEGLKTKLMEAGNKKIILLSFPGNPTGFTPSVDEAEKVVESIEKAAISGKKIITIIDDSYFGFLYEEDIFKESFFSKLVDLHKNVMAVKLDGATKEDFAWGLRVGFITYGIKDADREFYTALENKTAGALRGNISCASNLSQSLVLKAINSENYHNEKEQKNKILKKRYEKVKQIFENNKKYSSFFEPLPFNSGYFVCLKLKNKLNEEVRQTLLKEYSTGVISLGKVIRVSYASVAEDKLEALFENIYKSCNKN